MSQDALPNSTVSSSNVVQHGSGSNYHDFVAVDDSNYLEFQASADTELFIGLSSITDPVVNTDHVLHFIIGTDFGAQFVTFQLIHNGSAISTIADFEVTGGLHSDQITFNSAHIANITNYGALGLFIGTPASNTQPVYLDLIKVTAPDAPVTANSGFFAFMCFLFLCKVIGYHLVGRNYDWRRKII